MYTQSWRNEAEVAEKLYISHAHTQKGGSFFLCLVENFIGVLYK